MARRTTKTVLENGVVWTVGKDISTSDLAQATRWSKGTDILDAYKAPSTTKCAIWTSWRHYFEELCEQKNKETASCMHKLTPQMYVLSRNAHFFTIGCRIGNTWYYVTSTRQERHLITDML